MKTIDLTMPAELTGRWSIEWIVADHAQVERGDPIAIARHRGERYLAFAPVTGELLLGIAAPFVVAAATVILAQVKAGTIQSSRPGERVALMSDERQVYLEKLKAIVKEAVKDDFAAVNGRLDKVDNQLSSIDATLQAINGRLGRIEKK